MLHSNLLDTAGRDCPTKKKDPRHPKAARARQGGNKKKETGGPRKKRGVPNTRHIFFRHKEKVLYKHTLKGKLRGLLL
jgi:hypothetical protein